MSKIWVGNPNMGFVALNISHITHTLLDIHVCDTVVTVLQMALET